MSNFQEVLVESDVLVSRIRQCPVVQRMDNIRTAAYDAGFRGVRDFYLTGQGFVKLFVPASISLPTIEIFKSNLQVNFTPVPPGRYPGARY